MFVKYPFEPYPLNKAYPPFTKDKIKTLLGLMKFTNTTQCGMLKRILAIIIAIIIIKWIIQGKLSTKTFTKIKNTLKILF
jgi:hypothetical protein